MCTKQGVAGVQLHVIVHMYIYYIYMCVAACVTIYVCHV